jgi:hypothetical protein
MKEMKLGHPGGIKTEFVSQRDLFESLAIPVGHGLIRSTGKLIEESEFH